MLKKKRGRWKTHMKSNQGDHTLYPSFTHNAHANSSFADALWTSIKFRPSCMSACNKQREVQGRGAGGKRGGRKERRKDGGGRKKSSLGGQIRKDCLKAWLKFLCFITLLFKWAVDKKKDEKKKKKWKKAREVQCCEAGLILNRLFNNGNSA